MKQINERGLVMIGCGFMGKALLEGWLARGVDPGAVYVQDPRPSEWVLSQTGLRVNETPPSAPAVVLIAIKPQGLSAALPDLVRFGGGDTLVVSIVTGVALDVYEAALGQGTPVVRVMPNLPAAVGAGVSVYACNAHVSAAQNILAAELFHAVGSAIQLQDEDQIHAVTGISGSGPAYLFAMAEAMTQAGQALGLPDRLARSLAVETIAGAGQMMRDTGTDPAELRQAVTSKGGTTAEALKVLLASGNGLPDLMEQAARASCERSKVLGQN
ncbi:pyrroline-5-carboxylate reductase [Shimia sp.]|uniref:pyrroline-5-carboxylate reductase n=1 Tax=Shimia sp. TaxID=1954381 RepID=UPI003298F9F3